MNGNSTTEAGQTLQDAGHDQSREGQGQGSFSQNTREGRNLVICCDGTNNEFGPVNTNVVRMVQVLDRNPLKQRLYYDPGVGTMPDPGAWGSIRKWSSKVAGLAFGAGLDGNVEEAYTYLMDVWEPGDRVFLFGFSRGAYTARVLAGMLHTVGLLPSGSYNLVPYALRLYREVRKQRAKGSGEEWKKTCAEFRWTFAKPVNEQDEERHFPVHFLGLWDTVSSVGWVWDPVRFPYTARNPSVGTIRHAISIDERRWFFRQNQMKPAGRENSAQDLKEIWFSGVHSDVGGGYEPMHEGRCAELWRVPFDWMRKEAEAKGLLLDADRLEKVLHEIPKEPRPWNDLQHESLAGSWWAAEFFPKQVWDTKRQKQRWDIGRGRRRDLPDGAWIHSSALWRIKQNDLSYMPGNISPEFLKMVRELETVPEELQYFRDGRRPESPNSLENTSNS